MSDFTEIKCRLAKCQTTVAKIEAVVEEHTEQTEASRKRITRITLNLIMVQRYMEWTIEDMENNE